MREMERTCCCCCCHVALSGHIATSLSQGGEDEGEGERKRGGCVVIRTRKRVGCIIHCCCCCHVMVVTCEGGG